MAGGTVHDCFFRQLHSATAQRTAAQARLFFLTSRKSSYASRSSRSQHPSIGKRPRNGRFQHLLVNHLPARSNFSTSTSARASPVPLNAPEAASANAYCSDLIRQYDSPSYTLSHFIPPTALPSYTAIRALNIELSRVPDIVSNTAIGQMRYQFWRQTINSTFAGNPPEEPVAILLGAVLNDEASKRHGIRLNKSWFQRLVSAREEALTRPGFVNLDALERYAENTYSTLLYLTLGAVPLNSMVVDHVASHIGKAAGIAAVLRGVPLLAFPPAANTHNVNPPGAGLPMTRDRQRVVNLPLDVMARCGVREEDVFRNGGGAEGLRDAIFEVATRASDHLITARSLLKQVQGGEDVGHEFEHSDEEGFDYASDRLNDKGTAQGDMKRGFGVIMGPAVSTQLWLDKLQKVDFDIFHSSLRVTEWKLPLVAWWKNRQYAI